MLLLQMAERFTHCLSGDDFLARLEGDEFAFYYNGVDRMKELHTLAERIMQVLEPVFIINDYRVHLTARIGVTLISDSHPEDSDTLMKHADVALSRAKESGKNIYRIFSKEMLNVSYNN